MLIYYSLLVIMTILGSIAAIFLKRASGFKDIKILIKKRDIYIGAALYFISALINIYILKYLDYSVVLPLTSITYIWTMVFSYFLLKEKIGLKKIIGVLGILLGSVLITI